MLIDDYINCDYLIKEANELYEIALKKKINDYDLEYLISTNKYINKYKSFREELIKEYIDDLSAVVRDCDESNS